MPRDIKLLTIFVSCPQDLAPERSALESVIDELNQKLRDSTGQKRPVVTISESEGEEEEDAAGMLHAVVEAGESMDAGLAALSRITIINAENNSKLEEHAKEIAAINSSGVNAPLENCRKRCS